MQPDQPLPNRRFSFARSKGVVLVTATLLVGLAIRAFAVPVRSLWFDEAFCWRMIRFPLPELLRRVAQDSHPPLYFVVLKGWAALFGESVWALRGLSVLLGGGAIVGMALCVREAFRDDGDPQAARRAAWLTAALIALSVFQIRWSCEVRMYALGAALAALSSWALLRALRSPGAGVRRWMAYALLALVFLYTHYYALFSVAAHALVVVGTLAPRLHAGWKRAPRQSTAADKVTAVETSRDLLGRLRGPAVAACIILAGWLPWLPQLLAQREKVRETFWIGPFEWWDVPPACYRMFVEPLSAQPDKTAGAIVFALCIGVLLSLLPRARFGEWFVVTSATVPFGLSVLLSLGDTNVFYFRYFLFAHLFLLAALARAVTRLPGTARTAVAMILLFDFAAIDVLFWQRMDFAERPGMRAAMAYVERHRNLAEPVVADSPMFYLPALYHARNRSRIYIDTGGARIPHYEGTAALVAGDVLSDAELREMRTRRLWAVDVAGGGWGGRRRMDLPEHWTKGMTERFREASGLEGTILVTEYRRTTPPTRGEAPPPTRPAETE